MRALGIVFISILLICSLVMGQTMSDELAKLRQHLNIPESISISPAISTNLPEAIPLKIYIATGLDMKVRDNFVKWIEKWNEKDGKKYGLIEIVSEINNADIILARYTNRDQVTSKMVSGTNVVTGTTSTYSVSRVPLYSYVLARDSNGLKILWRYTGQTYVKEYSDSGEELKNQIFKMLKARAKNK